MEKSQPVKTINLLLCGALQNLQSTSTSDMLAKQSIKYLVKKFKEVLI